MDQAALLVRRGDSGWPARLSVEQGEHLGQFAHWRREFRAFPWNRHPDPGDAAEREHGSQPVRCVRPKKSRPSRRDPVVTSAGFSFGHRLFGNAAFEVVQFSFHFYGFKTYNVLVNPNNPIVQTVLTTMIESGDYFFFALGADEPPRHSGRKSGRRTCADWRPIFRGSDARPRQTLSTGTRSPLSRNIPSRRVCFSIGSAETMLPI
jgi:hypothetical protein